MGILRANIKGKINDRYRKFLVVNFDMSSEESASERIDGDKISGLVMSPNMHG